MFSYAPAEIIGNADIQRAVTLARQDVDVKAIAQEIRPLRELLALGPGSRFARPGTRSPSYAAGVLFNRSRISLPVLKNGTDFCATETWAPVRGLRPVRAGRFFTENAPKPRSSTRSPRDMAPVTSPRMALTMFSTSR